LENYLYLLVDLGCLSIPFAFSFGKKVSFYKSWKPISLAFLIVGIPFLIWDMLFTWRGVWGFNETYLSGAELFLLPIEEWLFFLCIPYACLFTYEFVRFFRKDKKDKKHQFLMLMLFIVTVSLAIISGGGVYSLSSFGLASIFTLVCLWKNPSWLGNFLRMFALIVIPFMISNGILTGLKFWEYPLLNLDPNVSDMIVWYNNNENLGIRIFSIPVEDIFYAFSLLGFQIMILENIRKRGFLNFK